MKILSILFFIFILFAIVSLIVWAISNMLNKNSNSSKKTFVQAKSTTSEEIKELKTKKNISLSNIDKSSTKKFSQNEFLDEITKTKLQQIDFSEKERNRGLMHIFLIFKNLQGISFKEIEIKPQHTFSKLYFKSGDEQNWQFSNFNFATIFRSFSDEVFESELKKILDENNIDINHEEKTKYGRFWIGKGFKIEVPVIKNYNVILISNENVINSEIFVASIRKEKKIEEYKVGTELAINPNNIFFLEENQPITKFFGVQLEDLKDIPAPTKNNSELLFRLFKGEIHPLNEKQIIYGLPLIERRIFRNLIGFPFHNVKIKENDGTISPDEFFTSDIDGNWFYATMNFSMLFKCFSDSTFNKELDRLLKINNIDKNDIVKEGQYDYWAGDGFKIECPKINNSKVIIISNENLTRPDATTFQSTDKSDLNNVDWVKGLEKIYNGKKALKNSSNIISDYYNVPMYFNEEKNSNDFILIPNQNIVPSKILIDRIIENNGGKEEFKYVGDVEDDWKYVHEGKEFLVGYLSKSYCIRLNQLVKPTFSNELEELEHNLQNLKLPEDSDPKSWIKILDTRANGRKMFIETLKQTYWEMSLAHTEEYVAKYKEGIMGIEDIYYRIDVYNVFIKEYEKFFKKLQLKNKSIPEQIENKFFALLESLIGAEYTLIVMKENGEKIDDNKIYEKIDRLNQGVVVENEDSEDENFQDKNEFSYYKGFLFNGKYVTHSDDKKTEILFRHGLKHGITKIFEKNGDLHEERIYFNDKFIGLKENKIEKVLDKDRKEVIKAFNDYSDKEKRNIQISAFIKCVYELISVDGKITEEEQAKFQEFIKEISTEFSDDINPESTEHQFVMEGKDNIIDAIKGFNKEDLDFFFNTLISFALVDGELALEEANLIGEIASEVIEGLDSREKLHKWFTEQIKKSSNNY